MSERIDLGGDGGYQASIARTFKGAPSVLIEDSCGEILLSYEQIKALAFELDLIIADIEDEDDQRENMLRALGHTGETH